jgi:excisionase family DNA binding protein
MSHEYITVEAAAQRSGLHPNTLRRLLRAGVISGYKASYEGKQHWLVSPRSLKTYADPVVGFLLDLPGPKPFLKKAQP